MPDDMKPTAEEFREAVAEGKTALRGAESYEQLFGKVVNALGVFASAIRSGEKWSEACEQVNREAHDALTKIDALQQRASEGWQRDVLNWAVDKFGPVALDRRERAMRFVEEALELGQAEALTQQEVLVIAARVFSRAPGDTGKEIAQAGLTLEALAENAGFKVAPLVQSEIARIKSITKEEWQQRHAAKIKVGAALSADPHPRHSEWRDISTAPKDGRKVDLWRVKQSGKVIAPHRVSNARYLQTTNFGGTWDCDNHYAVTMDFSHWMPLPAGPHTADEREGK